MTTAASPVCEFCRLEIESDAQHYDHLAERRRVYFHQACRDEQARRFEERRRAAEAERRRKERVRRFRQSFADSSVGASLGARELGWINAHRDDESEEVYSSGPLRFPAWTFNRFENEEFRRRVDPRLLAAAEAYEPKQHGSLVLCGPTGRGKSALAAAWIWRHRDQLMARVEAGEQLVMSFAWVSGFELAGCRKRSGLGEEAPIVKLASEIPTLVLDEVGQEPPGEETFVALDARYREGRPVILTSPLTPDALARHLGGGAYRRVLEHGVLVEAFGEVPKAKGAVRVVR